jgi:hypothetical protein
MDDIVDADAANSSTICSSYASVQEYSFPDMFLPPPTPIQAWLNGDIHDSSDDPSADNSVADLMGNYYKSLITIIFACSIDPLFNTSVVHYYL